MMEDDLQFDPWLGRALAESVDSSAGPSSHVKEQLMAKLRNNREPVSAVPEGFVFKFADDTDWLPHPVPGIRMKVLAMNRQRKRATLLLDVAPGTRFPPHHHDGDEECYVLSGSLMSCGRRIGAGDFLHADEGSDHGELWTDVGCRVLLVVAPEDYMPESQPSSLSGS